MATQMIKKRKFVADGVLFTKLNEAKSFYYKLLIGFIVCKACYGVLEFVIKSGAKGCEVIVSEKLRAKEKNS
ncbi:40S ribosomal protein S3-2 [Spatholobus suberectus]|nr:40S ribosomal protein S3-2 [Spatholobus suberectus]